MSLSLLAWVVGLVVVLLIVLLLVLWLRNRNGAAVRSFYLAVRQMEHEQGVSDRYQAPWLLMLGDEVEGKRLCASWNLNPVDKPAWFGRWWADPSGAVLVVPQALFMPGEGMKQSSGWWNLISLLLRLRTRRPLDGVIWTVAAADLLDPDRAATLGLDARRRFIDLLQRLGISLPVYVVITGMDEVPGFQELARALPEEARRQVLGWSSPFAADAAWQSQWTDDALDGITYALSEAIVQMGTLSGQLSGDLDTLPQRFEGMRRNLQMLLWPVFQGNTHGEAPALRGLYFTGAQAIAGAADSFTALDQPPLQNVFAQGLWQQRINAERGLARPIPRLLQLRQRWQRVAAFSAALVGVIWAIAMVWVWRDSLRDAGELSRLLQNAQNDYISISDDSHRQELTRHNVQSFWNVLERAPRWHFTSLVYPTSWFSSLDGQMDQVLQHTSMSHMNQPIHDLLQAELRDVLALGEAGRRGSAPQGGDPAQWPSYLKARELVDKTLRLEQAATLYAQAQANQKSPLDQLIPLSNQTLDMNLNVGTLPFEKYYNRLLVNQGISPLKPIDLSLHRSAIQASFNQLMETWLGHYFRTDGYVTSAGYLKLYLDRLENGSGQTLRELEHMDALIEDLQASIDLTNATWSRGKGQDLVAGYGEMLEKVRQSKLLGPAIADETERVAEQLQYRFKDQWVAQGGASKQLLVQSSTGQLSLQERIIHLQSAINLLLKRDFVARALREEPLGDSAQLTRVDSEGLRLAQSYYDSYKLYAHESLSGIPPVYRNALLKTAENTAGDAMWASLNRQTAESQILSAPSFQVRTDQALAVHRAFVQLQRPDLASGLQSALNQSALADVSQAIDEVFQQPVFRDRADINQWDGSKEFGLRLFRAIDAQDLKSSLDQQFAVITAITEESAPAKDWLMTQLPNLNLTESELVSRFNSLGEEMVKYKAQNPSSSPALITQLIVRDFNDMDQGNCLKILGSATAPHATGQLTQRWVGLQQAALQRCQWLQRQAVASAWNDLAGYFNQYLAGRFPFALDRHAPDADPARVQYFLTLIDNRLAQARDGLGLLTLRERAAAGEFLDRIALARPWLGAMLVRDKAGLSGIDLEVTWRTDRDSERGADQVIAWTLGSGVREIVWPGDEQVLHWSVGQPLNLRLRWARDGTQRPVNDPLQQQLHVSGLEAEWQYQGPWALLRMMAAHSSMLRQPNVDYTEFPLSLEVPVHAQPEEDNQTQMFLRLSLMSQGGKAPLSIHPLPVQAPHSPFGYTPRSVADSGDYP
ncbi:type VI secretion system protein [Pseudomonas sp. zfem002]|uniref:type VI secretion system protein n=1 Tax=Pseudomonas sp. zfem002 TaxID=3078197 RepID=UPI0029275BA9|nr:type VI secretion protein IcmF/TssM N-terminal domain-containing protein [Pseudomonas sp. zfem002]MDU9389024.1 type VI secretion protein IcmF/TssM N-terminal domain-containing protein [Pseudomonas sp. zfem002]